MNKRISKKRRNVTAHDREIDSRNANLGVKKWVKTPTGARKAERVRTRHGWGFEGQTPKTRTRKYKNKA